MEHVPPIRFRTRLIRGERTNESTYRLSEVVKKSAPSEAPSHLDTVGRYLMTPDLFDCIKRVARGTQGEMQLTEAIRVLLNERDFYVHVIEGSRYKAGENRLHKSSH